MCIGVAVFVRILVGYKRVGFGGREQGWEMVGGTIGIRVKALGVLDFCETSCYSVDD